MMAAGPSSAVSTATVELNKFKSFVDMLVDTNRKDETFKLNCMQEVSENFEKIVSSSYYSIFLDHSINIFLRYLQDNEPHFIGEYGTQQVRKLILEIIHRFPTNEYLMPHVPAIISLTLKLLAIDNEENVLVCLKIIIELHKSYRPAFNDEIKKFLQFVKLIYSELPSHMNKIFEPKAPIRVKDLSELNIEELLKETYTTTTIQLEPSPEKKTKEPCQCNLIPKAVLSLKVIQELPIIVVLMYQLYKQSVHQDVADFIPLIMNTIVLQPSLQQRQAETFNKEIFVDFMGAQIKTLSFLAYIIKIYQEVVAAHSDMLVQGILGLLTLCPQEVAHLRKELLIASRHILATELRFKFVPHMEKLFDEQVLLGKGWTTHESLRPLAYSTLADLVHHVRQHLSLNDIGRAVHLFSKIVHDDSLATTIQTMCFKLLLNLVECIRKKPEVESAEGRQLLLRMLEIFVLKFKTIAKIQLPKMIERFKQQSAAAQSLTSSNPVTGIELKLEAEATSRAVSAAEAIVENPLSASAQKDEKSKFGFPQSNNYNVTEYRSLVRFLVCGVKTITWGCSAAKPGLNQTSAGAKPFQPHETLIFIRLVKWALKSLDIYTIPMGPMVTGPARISQQNARTKDEKEVLEHFSCVFSMMHPQTFHEIFSTTIEYVVSRVYENSTLQTVPNTLLANPTTSPIFATVLVEYLLERMEEMGSNQERSSLYLKLFKLVFGSVSLFPQENEKMLRPHLHQIVNRSMELAMVAKEPRNYFLLLRALFRSIGGGSHDLLYQEFLPLLPNLLEGLNRLQSGLHKQDMKELFVELCLTVPVRLSSLLPYLPMLMDPLVSALNGAHMLISQGLRTLELCVDNLQHDFLYEHIQPVRAELMQALWRTLRNNDQVAQVAFKVLGKFGGGNRKMMIEPQKLDYISTDYDQPAIIAYFNDHDKPIEFPVDSVIQTAFNALMEANTDSFYRRQAWDAIYCYLMASLNLNDDINSLTKLFLHYSFQNCDYSPEVSAANYKSTNKRARQTHKTALIGLFVAAGIKELKDSVNQPLTNIVTHYTMVAVAQQAGMFAITPRPNEQMALDPLVLIDALAVIMGHEDKKLLQPGQMALEMILDTASTLMGSKDLACKLPLIEYMSEQLCALCYERAWYAKIGGCHAIKFMFEKCAIKWVYKHMFTFLKSLLFVMMDLTGEVSSGALDIAKQNLEEMLIVLVTPLPPNADEMTIKLQREALNKITHLLVREVISTDTLVREQSMKSLKLLAERQQKTITAVMEPFKSVLADVVPPKKFLLQHQSAITQIGLMDGNMFCTTLEPRLLTMDMKEKEHQLFIEELISLCSAPDEKLMNLSCYKNVTNFTPVRVSALRVLAACHYLEADIRKKIFLVLYKTLENAEKPELQQAAFECMKSFNTGCPIDENLLQATMEPLLMSLDDVNNLTLNVVKMLSYLTQLFPNIFQEKNCEQLLGLLKQLFKKIVSTTDVAKKAEEIQKAVIVISFYYQTASASSKFIKPLCQLIFQAESAMMIEASSKFREVLLKFLMRYPIETIDLFMDEMHIKDPQHSRYLEFILKHNDGKVFRDYIQKQKVKHITQLIMYNYQLGNNYSSQVKNEFQYQAIRVIYLLIKKDEQWLASQDKLVKLLQSIWCRDEYQQRHTQVDQLEIPHWREPKMLVKILLHYFIHHPSNIALLFQLLRALCDRFIPEFTFLKDFLENTVAQNYTVEWKRSAFFLFVKKFPQDDMSQELKAKVLQLVLIPCFAVSFDRGETNKLIGTEPAPYNDNKENIVSVFINELIDPDNPFPFADCVRISLLQFSCLLIEQASPHIHDHDPHNKAQGSKLRRLMTFAWPCLLGKNCVDAATRYHGHLLLSHIIDKFAIHRKIVLQVFHSLLKAHGLEARNVVRQALDILTPSIPLRLTDTNKTQSPNDPSPMEEGNHKLTYWTKKIIVDEGHSMQQLSHILQLMVKHYMVYYPVRHQLVQYMVSSVQRLGSNPTASFEHRKLAVELCEVIIKWELHGIREDLDADSIVVDSGTKKRSAYDDMSDHQRKRFAYQIDGNSSQPVSIKIESSAAASRVGKEPLDRVHTDAVLSFLMRFACQVSDQTTQNPPNPTTTAGNPGEILSRRCVQLLKTALKPDVWPQPIDIKLTIFDKFLATVGSQNQSVIGICTALELMTFLLSVLKKDQILAGLKPMEINIGKCLTSNNNKIIRYMHSFLHKLMGIFPVERSSSTQCKHEELNLLYSTISKVIADGLVNYEKKPEATTSSLYGTIMILKAACMNNNSYIDMQITPFMKVLQKIFKEHLQPTTQEANLITSELLILCLDLVKNRVAIMGVEMRKTFIGAILVGLLEKTPDIKVMKAIVKMLEEWMRNKDNIAITQAPSLREKSILLVKLMQYVEKRFPEEVDLNNQFLELIHFVYLDEQLKQTELSAKLESAFLAGLRCNQPHIRRKFFKIFDESMRKRLHDRLLYITSTQNWDAMGPHYWIKQCIELLLVTAQPEVRIKMSHDSSVVPNITSVINQADIKKREEFHSVKTEAADFINISNIKTELLEETKPFLINTVGEERVVNRVEKINTMTKDHFDFSMSSKDVTSYRFLNAASQLCYYDTTLAEKVWLAVFPKLWSILDETQRNRVVQEIRPFISSGSHIVQKDCYPSSINTFVEALSRCNPPVYIYPHLMKYLAKSHNLWHRLTLNLEQMVYDPSSTPARPPMNPKFDFEQDPNTKHDILDALGELYHNLCEEDMWAGLWQRHAQYKETTIAIAYEQHGLFEQAQTAYENAMAKQKQNNALGPAPVSAQREILMWTDRWIRCAKELKQWSTLLEYSKTGVHNPYLLLESAWRKPDWALAKEGMNSVEYSCPKELQWKVTLYGGYLLICNPEEKPLKLAEKYVESATSLCLQEWRRLPHIVSHCHLTYLQAAQQIMELQEAYQIRKSLAQAQQTSIHDMKAIVKTWRNRLPVIADDLAHWNDIFSWRHLHYDFIIKHYEKLADSQGHYPNSMLGVHASAHSIIHFAKISRKHKLNNVCLEELNRIYLIQSVPIIDCFQKICQQVKCYVQIAHMKNSNDYQVALDTINSAKVELFTQEMNAEFYALKGNLYHLSGKTDEANKSFSAAIQLKDTHAKSWALYGEYLEQIFTKDPKNMSIGVNAIVCLLHACRTPNESKARKYIAKILYLLAYDDDKNSLIKALDTYQVGVPPMLWLSWTPQLFNLLMLHDHNAILNILLQVGKMFPQAVYFPFRTLYLSLRAAAVQQPTENQQEQGGSEQQSEQSEQNKEGTTSSGTSANPKSIPASPGLRRCSILMKLQRDINTALLTSLEAIAEQMEWFKEYWYEVVLRQLRQGLAKCYAIAFENRDNVNEAKITQHILNFVRILVKSFGIVENKTSANNATAHQTAASRSLARRADATRQDPVYQKMKQEFTKDFELENESQESSSIKLTVLIFKLKKWIKILENRSKMMQQQSFLIEDQCRFLSNFTLKTAEVELPGEFLLPKHTHYYVKIARFMPRVDIVQKHNTAARRLYIRGHNGKIYPYLVVNDSSLADAGREERVLQMLRMLNLYLGKQKETSRRFLNFTVPRVVIISQQIRLVEDNVASVSLLDVFEKGCAKMGIEHDEPINQYYEKLAAVQSRGLKVSHQVYREILKGVQTKMVPRNLLRKWALTTYPSSTDYWHFRKIFTLQLALACFAEYVFHLTRLNPDMIYMHQDSGLINISYFKFDVNDATGELDIPRSVPFRLTPNIVEFISAIGINGPLTASMIATAKCFTYPNFKVTSILKLILWDEMVTSKIKKALGSDYTKDDILTDKDQIITVVNKAVTSITGRLISLAQMDGVDSKVSTLVAAASSQDNLCRMDPAWHPWL